MRTLFKYILKRAYYASLINNPIFTTPNERFDAVKKSLSLDFLLVCFHAYYRNPNDDCKDFKTIQCNSVYLSIDYCIDFNTTYS